MQVLRLEDLGRGRGACVVALGFFDGLHIGHAALLERTVAAAEARGAVPCVFTFTDSPTFKGGVRLYPEEERLSRFADYGIARVVTADFPPLASLSPEEFVSDVLIGRLGATAVVCGFNYRFGARAAGDAALLGRLLSAYGVPLYPVAEMTYGGKTVSTSEIKAALSAGDADMASAMLGRPYTLTGRVVHGKALGRTIGVPTANIPFPCRVFVPRRGVWAVRCDVEGMDRPVCGIANVGVRPTVESTDADNCEVHFLTPVPELYGRHMRVHFLSFMRPEITFSDLAALRARIDLDKEIAKEFFANGMD